MNQISYVGVLVEVVEVNEVVVMMVADAVKGRAPTANGEAFAIAVGCGCCSARSRSAIRKEVVK